ncbi:hypothetical protein EW145_g2268 [Phellinidium pouzarii]|uniref:Calcium-transporting ATPase n=1 Tax=Phellinidium pouzarii TaxID=167371 RepID=A0A4S4LBH3_9AGAM|nr:hypothetical protein EW145_g2268 [Phellinidium pouzarii]
MLGHQKKRSSSNELPTFASRAGGHISSFSTASSLSRQPLPGRGNTSFSQRDPSPPASAYFSGYTETEEPTASKDAGAHFAYSTTLRRHNIESGHTSGAGGSSSKFQSLGRIVGSEGAELIDRVISTVAGKPSLEERMEEGHMNMNGNGHAEKTLQETPSSIHAHSTVEDTASQFNTSLTRGLSSSEIPALREIHGYNEFSVGTPEPVLLKFAKTIYEQPLILLLFGSAIISAIMHNIDDAVSITIAILIVLTVGFVQERRSEKSLEALNKLVPHYCHLTRDGYSTRVLANELVPGDLVTFTVGDRIPADIRLVSAVDLEIDESSLTGETRPAMKSIAQCDVPQYRPGETVALAERTCVAYLGTLVRNGHGKGIVIATGEQTEFGVIFTMMQDVEEKRTPLQLSMDELAKKLSLLSFGIIGVICVIGVLQKRHWLEMFTIGGAISKVSLAVAAIPEGLPIVTTVTLALGVLRMSRRNAIVKKLPSVEALGSVNVICSDKTGTLTKNEQTVIEVYTVDESMVVDPSMPHVKVSPALRKALQIGSICNNAVVNESGVFAGQSTDVALLNVLHMFNFSDQRADFNRSSERPFNSEQKYMAVSGTHTTDTDTRERCFMKGALESVLDRCKFYYVSEESSPGLDSSLKAMIVNKAREAADRGLRVIALAYGFGSVDVIDPIASPSLVFVGFQCMRDPPRPGVADAVAALQAGGVHVVMITGDAEHTALAIGRQLGLHVSTGGAGCMSGAAIDRMSPAQLSECVRSISIFARTTPRHKMAIIEAFRERGDIVAMTGDGVNDAPALKMADIGVSMGKSGTDVAKEAADMILVDDNFSTILSAVEEGKSIFYNIQNFLSFQLSTAVAALMLITMSTFFGLHNPLNAMQILFINILMDGPPSQSLGVDPADPAVMRKPPRKKDEDIISRRVVGRVIFSASVIVFGTLFIYATALSDAMMSNRDQTMTFTCFVFLDLVSALQNRGLGCGFMQNRMLLATVGVSFVVQLALVYVPFMQAVFQTEALALADLGTLFMLAATAFTLHEARRRYERHLNTEEQLSYMSLDALV